MVKQLIRMLLVDDDNPPLRELKRAFEVAPSERYSFEVHTAQSVGEYHQATRQYDYAVVVVDIRLATGEEGIDSITAFHSRRWPATIIIVYSAFPELDTVSACVRAMKTGASDCIHKGSDDSVRRVVESAIRELDARSDNQEDGPSSEWLMENLDDLQARYGDRYVAFVGNEVACSADSVAALRRELGAAAIQGLPYIMAIPRREEHK